MKQGTSALVATAIFLAGAGAAAAQMLPPPGPRVIYGSQAYYHDGRVAPHAPLDGALPSYEVAAILQSAGYLPLGGPTRRGNFYVVAAAHPRGDEGRVVIDAYTGRIVRFIPASVIRASRGGDDMVMVYQGRAFPPPGIAPPPYPAARGVPRPPGSIPNVASRTPSSGPVAPRPRPQAAPTKPDTAQAPPVPAPVETKPAAASPPLAKSPLEKAPAMQPTKPLPPVQTME